MRFAMNEKCWCNSGLEFKNCHYNRDRLAPVSQGEAIRASKDLSLRKACYVPSVLKDECSSKIIKAHTVSKSGSLEPISDSTNHVLGLKISLANLIKNDGRLQLEKIGINQASTFTGFCSYHDKSLFSCIEDRPFQADEEQCFALLYRSISKELYAKEGALKTNDLLKGMDNGKSEFQQVLIQSFVADYKLGVEAAIQELSTLKLKLDDELVGKSSLDICHVVLEFNKYLPIVVSSICSPTEDFQGNSIQDLSDLTVEAQPLFFNSFSSGGKSFVVFSFLKKDFKIRGFVDSFLCIEQSKMFTALVSFFCGSAENIFVSPDWWDSLVSKPKRKINKLLLAGIFQTSDSYSKMLVDDGTFFPTDATIESIKRLNF